jgi:hypothetical protein
MLAKISGSSYCSCACESHVLGASPLPVNYSIDTQHPLVYTVFSGDVSNADMLEHLRSLYADPRFEASMPELVDLRGVTSVSVSSEMIPASARWPLHSPLAPRAIVAPTDLLYGLARMYQSYRDEKGEAHLAIFRTLPPALEWLGRDEPPPPL